MSSILLAIDAQFDFVDPKGSLSVPGAVEDTNRIIEMINRAGDKLDDIRITLDSHHHIHVAHPIYWERGDGSGDRPLDIISAIQKGDITEAFISLDKVTGPNPWWRARNPKWRKQAVDYVTALSETIHPVTGEKGRYGLTIWPPHCRIGTQGTALFKPFSDALLGWEDRNFGVVDVCVKGDDLHTEHYSVVKAEVPNNNPATHLNERFVRTLEEFDEIFVAGQASSHCVAATIYDTIAEFGAENVSKLVLLEDAMSAVPGCEQFATDFFAYAKSKGVRFAKTTDAL
jgi:nicotinamidase-related amidase